MKMDKEMCDIERLMEVLSKEELGEFIRKECAMDKRLRNRFLALGAGRVYAPDPETYAERMRDLIDDFSERCGYITYSDSFAFNRQAMAMISEAETAMVQENWGVAAAVLLGVADCGEDILESGDDSAGEISGVVDACFENLIELAKHDLPEEVGERLFEHAMTKFEQGHMKGWDYRWSWMGIAIEQARNEERQGRVFAALDSIEKPANDEWVRRYDYEIAQRYRMDIMSHCGTEEEQKAFLYANVDVPDFRERLLQKAWTSEDCDEVLRLAEEGVEHDKGSSGLVNVWHKWQMRVYKQRDDKKNIMRMARYFFCQGGLMWDTEYEYVKMYALMKSIVSPEEWPVEVEALLKKCQANNSYLSTYIYEQEKMWPEYMEYVRRHPSTFSVDEAPEEVKELYRDEIISMYAKGVRGEFESANCRSHYQSCVEYLRKLIALGGTKEAEAIAEEQKARRPRRPALLDELSKL